MTVKLAERCEMPSGAVCIAHEYSEAVTEQFNRCIRFNAPSPENSDAVAYIKSGLLTHHILLSWGKAHPSHCSVIRPIGLSVGQSAVENAGDLQESGRPSGPTTPTAQALRFKGLGIVLPHIVRPWGKIGPDLRNLHRVFVNLGLQFHRPRIGNPSRDMAKACPLK